jgi:malate permease and related proteins
MNQTNHVFSVTLCVIAVGYLVKKRGFITENDGKTLSKLLMHTTFPALTLISTYRIDFKPTSPLLSGGGIVSIPIFGLFFSFLMMLWAWFVFKKAENDVRGLMVMSAGGLNLGLFAFPIIQDIWGQEGLSYAVLLDIGNTLVSFGMVYSVGQYFAAKRGGTSLNNQALKTAIFKKIIQSLPVQGMILGLCLNFSGFKLPSVVIDFLDVLAKGNKPLGLLLLGIYLNFGLTKNELLNLSKLLSVRYAWGLLVGLVLYGVLPPSVLRSVLVISLILPIGLVVLPFSDELKYDSRVAGLLLNLSLVISFALMWVLILGLGLV